MKTGYESGIGAWYDKLSFTEACGRGSYPNKNVEYCRQLMKTLDGLEVSKVVDLGCGNMESYKGHINWEETKYEYVGYEANLIALSQLKKRYENLRFVQSKLGEIPEVGDVLIIKDVLIHWYDEAITNFFNDVFENFRYVIYMHSTTEQGYPNRVKREMYNIKNPADRVGHKLNEIPPEGYRYWPKPNGCFGYKCVPYELLPENKIAFKTNIMGDSMKTFILFDKTLSK